MEIKKEEWMRQGNIVQNKIGLQEYVMYVGVEREGVILHVR